jgi:hypothetical protein
MVTTSWHFKRTVIKVFKPTQDPLKKDNVKRGKEKDLDTKFFS